MPRPTGMLKTGGRKKGTPNKATLDVKEALNSLNVNIPAQICELLPQLQLEKRVDVLLKLMPYVYPHLKPSEQITNNSGPTTFTEFIVQLEVDIAAESGVAP